MTNLYVTYFLTKFFEVKLDLKLFFKAIEFSLFHAQYI